MEWLAEQQKMPSPKVLSRGAGLLDRWAKLIPQVGN
jgi:hypothetical protein